MASSAVLIAASHSGAGKTTATGAVLSALRERGLAVQAFKLGPDFIDPAYHAEFTARPSINLDVWMMGERGVRESFQHWSEKADISVVESMGALHDGEDGTEHGSAAHVAKLLSIPVVLVLDVWGMTRTTGAVLEGLRAFDPAVDVVGCILNRVGSPTHRDMIMEALPLSLRQLVVGSIEHRAELAIGERHLGLVTPDENPEDVHARHEASAWAAAGLDIDRLLRLAQRPGPSSAPTRPRRATGVAPKSARIAVARDQAFSFYYQENLRILEGAGFEVVDFRPLADPQLPADVQAVYLGGGYPESFARELAGNRSLIRDLRAHVDEGMPVLAECGGLMYLGRSLTGFDGVRHELAGVLPLDVVMDPAHLAIRYVEVTSRVDSPLGPPRTTARGQEFHQSRIVDSDMEPNLFEVTTSTGLSYTDGYALNGVVASYFHLHLGSNPDVAAHLLRCCRG